MASCPRPPPRLRQGRQAAQLHVAVVLSPGQRRRYQGGDRLPTLAAAGDQRQGGWRPDQPVGAAVFFGAGMLPAPASMEGVITAPPKGNPGIRQVRCHPRRLPRLPRAGHDRHSGQRVRPRHPQPEAYRRYVTKPAVCPSHADRRPARRQQAGSRDAVAGCREDDRRRPGRAVRVSQSN